MKWVISGYELEPAKQVLADDVSDLLVYSSVLSYF